MPKFNRLRTKNKMSITTGLILYLLAVVTSISAGMIFILYLFLTSHAEKELSKKVREYSDYLESSIERPLWIYDEETLVNTADNFFKSSPIASLKILDLSEENILYENYTGERNYIISFHGNIIHEGELIGHIKMGLSSKEYRENINNIIYSASMVILIVTAGVMAFIFIFISGYIKKPLVNLIEGMKFISQGNYDYRFKDFRQKEFDQIRSSFHEMEEQINRREQTLKDINKKLTLEIEQRNKIEKALRESEEKFRRLAQTTSAGILVYQDDRWVYANPSAQKLTGYTMDELRLMHYWDIIDYDYIDMVREKGEKRQKNIDADSGYEVVIVSKTREKKWIYIEGGTTEYSGRPAGLVSFIDVTERKEAEKKSQQAVEFIQSIINSMPSVLLSIDRELNIKLWNKKAEERAGVSASKAYGNHLSEIFPHLDPEIEKINEAINSKNIIKTEKREYISEGRSFFEDIEIYPVETGEMKGAVIRIDDVTDRVMLDKAIIDAETARQSSKSKSEFLANMSHEVRTPLNGVLGMTSLVLDSELNQEQREYLEIVKNSGESLLSVINDILDFSKIDAGSFVLDEAEFELRKFVDDLAEEISAGAHEKELELIHFLDPELPEKIKGDPLRLKQILINLTGNAVKFTKQGEIVIRADIDWEDDTRISIKFYIHDTGIGFPDEKLESLFRPFEQLDGSYTREYGGTGLGLAICRQLVELMGGKIGAKSKIGNGSTFWVSIPFEKIAEAEEFQETEFEEVKGKKVLIVDDNETNRLLLKNLLKVWGCFYEEAENGFTAIEILREESMAGRPFEAAILDMCMPGMDGLELGKRIVADEMIRLPVLIMMSSMAQRGEMADLEKAGFSAYLTKPVKRDQLKKCISMAMGMKPNPSYEDILTEAKVDFADNADKKILIAEDNKVNQEVISRYMNRLGYEFDLASNGVEVLKMLKGLENKYSIIFMDCQMPEMDGFETAGRIKNGECGDLNIPVIAMTANAVDGDREACLKAGMDDYMSKPLNQDKLNEMIEKWLARKDSSPGSEGSRIKSY